jgi:hypothetical protein
MARKLLTAALAGVVFLAAGGDALACGDKFLVSSRGTRYHRPKTARAASIVIYGNPAAELSGKASLETVLKREGHRSTMVQTAEQLAALLAGGRFDVVLAAASVLDAVSSLVSAAPDGPVVVPVKAPVRDAALLRAVDKAVAQRDKHMRRSPLKG